MSSFEVIEKIVQANIRNIVYKKWLKNDCICSTLIKKRSILIHQINYQSASASSSV